jgi:DNA-binding GntR family transcriptional regulator
MPTGEQADIYSQFLQALASGSIRPGQRVGEVSLAARWGVSRLPVRDALIRLEAEGFVERRKQSGTYVKETDFDELKEMYSLRAVIEGWVVRQVAEVATEAQLNELERLAKKVDSTRPGEKAEKIIDRESKFHLRLCEIAGLRYTLRILNLHYLFVRSFQLQIQESGGGPTHVHRDLVAALRTRNGDRCEAWVKSHYQGHLKRLARQHTGKD